MKTGFVQVAPDASGKNIANYAAQMYVDPGDGTGAQLKTVYFQATAVVLVDANGVALETEDAFFLYDMQKKMLDELRAIRIGMERLNAERPANSADNELSLIEEAQQLREDTEDLAAGRQANAQPPQ